MQTIFMRKPFFACSAMAPPARQTKSPGWAVMTRPVFMGQTPLFRSYSTEDDRRDQDPDRLDEGVAERLHLRARLGIEYPKHDALRHGDEHLDPELLPPGAAARLIDRKRCHVSNPNRRAGLLTR